jgi:Ran GTPase-activating protein (RanGAP) involved in mRNA processing and transport
MENNSTLRRLCLGGNVLADRGAAAVASLLATKSGLTLVNLYNDDILAGGAACLASSLATNNVLKTFVAGANPFSDGGASAIAAALETNTTLTCLDLDSVGLTETGVLRLAQALRINRHLTTLDIGDQDLSQCASALVESGVMLRSLSLYCTSINAAVAGKVAAALEHHRNLTFIDLGINAIGDVGARLLAACVGRNSTLTTLLL